MPCLWSVSVLRIKPVGTGPRDKDCSKAGAGCRGWEWGWVPSAYRGDVGALPAGYTGGGMRSWLTGWSITCSENQKAVRISLAESAASQMRPSSNRLSHSSFFMIRDL
ncbi:hypothetical protein [Azospirillum melinis]